MIYNKEYLSDLISRAEKETITLECADNRDARRLSFALRRAASLNFLVRISVSQSTLTLSPRLAAPKFKVKEANNKL
jgi:hypothetical protein